MITSSEPGLAPSTAGTRSPVCSRLSPPTPAEASPSPDAGPTATRRRRSVLVLDLGLAPDGSQVCRTCTVAEPDKLSHAK
ncbi:hypothetical protein ACFVYP_14810 [Kitasatospora sp. NPDC058201]|uniref:hypothetical protein n=1 Tax=unclassified Kitasatospora TaxID=2633591 RepID=UPI0036561059